MKISRRKFLGAAAVSTGLSLVLDNKVFGQVGLTEPPIGDGGALGKLHFLSFYENLNTEFMFLDKDRNFVPVTLIAVEDARPVTKQQWAAGDENFVLSFRGPSELRLIQGTHKVEHFKLGKFSLFITEGQVDEQNRLYLAIINRVNSY